MDKSLLQEHASDAIRFWERGRIIYNAALVLVVVLHFVAGYPASKNVLSINLGLGLFLLAVVANILYCSAYVVDLFAQSTDFRDTWRRYRWLLLVIGTTFAAVIAHFMSQGAFVTIPPS